MQGPFRYRHFHKVPCNWCKNANAKDPFVCLFWALSELCTCVECYPDTSITMAFEKEPGKIFIRKMKKTETNGEKNDNNKKEKLGKNKMTILSRKCEKKGENPLNNWRKSAKKMTILSPKMSRMPMKVFSVPFPSLSVSMPDGTSKTTLIFQLIHANSWRYMCFSSARRLSFACSFSEAMASQVKSSRV